MAWIYVDTAEEEEGLLKCAQLILKVKYLFIWARAWIDHVNGITQLVYKCNT